MPKPWPWADTWPVARLQLPRLSVDLIVLAGAYGRTLAFGPGHVGSSALPGQQGTMMLVGHRDTHFQFLKEVRMEDRLELIGVDGTTRRYRVTEQRVMDSRRDSIATSHEGPELVLVTCFPFVVTVLSILRQAMGLQQAPPNMVIVSLSLFLTAFVMAPTFMASYEAGIQPYMAEAITLEEAIPRALGPVQAFMGQHANEADVALFANMAKIENLQSPETAPFHVLAPAFMISELKRAFEIGFMVFLPFLVIDLVVSSILMAMGMMMLPPTSIALPMKIIFFVLVDGWSLVAGSLVKSFIAPG